MTPETGRSWIGAPPTHVQSAATMFVGIVAIMIAGLQPQLLGALEAEGRVSAAQLGHAATAELLTMGITAALAGAWLKPTGLRWIGLGAGLALAAIDVATVRLAGEAVIAARGAAGVVSGLMMWIIIGMITRAPRPERWSGVYLTLQTLAQFALATFLTAFVMGRYGANGGWVALAGLSALAAVASLAMPSNYAALAHSDAPAGLPPPRGLAALAACFLFLALIIGVWVYAEPLSRQAGHPPSTVGAAVSLSLAFQVLGGGTATVLAGRVRWFWTLVACAIALAALLALFASLPSAPVFLATSAAFGFVWLFLMPFLVPMTIEADPTRRTAVLLGGAQLLGGSLGPLMASLLVTDTDARGAIWFGAACLVLATLVATALHLRPAPVTAVFDATEIL